MAPPKRTTVKKRFLILSDSHNFDVRDLDHARAFARPFPQVDVVLHCGDMTNTGSLEEYQLALNFLGSIPAEQRFVIAGNHDLSLDNEWWQNNLQVHNLDPTEPAQAMDVMKGRAAAAAGVTYLEEGTHHFNLSGGARFTIYASPYQPVFVDGAFKYPRDQDRFSRISPGQVASGYVYNAEHPIPDFPNVDIVMTHGPPRGVLDRCRAGNVGCANLLRAVQRARPLLHCFGHIHEGRNAVVASWQPPKRRTQERTRNLQEPIFDKTQKIPDIYPETVPCEVVFGQQTLMVNACIANGKLQLRNRPWIFDLEIPTRGAWRSRQEKASRATPSGAQRSIRTSGLCCVNPAAATMD